MRSPRSRLVLGSVLSVLLLGQTACIGSYSATGSLINWNRTLSSKWVNEIVFLAFNVVPVYSFTLFGDTFIFNVLEFWTGSHPFAATATERDALADVRTFESGDTRVVLERRTSDRGRELVVRSYQGEELMAESVLVDRGDGTALKLDPEGRVLASAELQPDGSVWFRDALAGAEKRIDPR